MVDELKLEVVDMVVTAVEKHFSNYESAAKVIKELMDKRCGSSWHVVVGEGFGFDVTHEMRNLMFMYFGGESGESISTPLVGGGGVLKRLPL
ncbi:dynein light chain type 1-domain-containing protein [Chytriomyces sp. MP71]|nr:dynein light chain type 1-domain-containing protein [Chytriomyces sp. MP71]